MELTVTDRLQLVDILGGLEGSIVTLRAARDLRAKLGFSADEAAELGLRQEGDKVYWDTLREQVLDFDLSKAEMDLIADQLRKLSNLGRLRDAHVNLYEAFVRD